MNESTKVGIREMMHKAVYQLGAALLVQHPGGLFLVVFNFYYFFNVGAECGKSPSWPMNLFFVSFIAGT